MIRLGERGEVSDPTAAAAAYSRASSLAETNGMWEVAGDARKRAEAALQAFGRAPGGWQDKRAAVRAWLAELG